MIIGKSSKSIFIENTEPIAVSSTQKVLLRILTVENLHLVSKLRIWRYAVICQYRK